MRRLAAAVLVAAAVLLAGCSGDSGDSKDDAAVEPLKPFTAADAKFRASFPGTPERSDQQVPAGSGTLRLVLYTVEVDADEGYSVGWFQLAAPPDGAGMNGFLEATRDGSVAAIKGTLVSSSFTTHAGQPALDFVAREPDDHFIKSRLVVRGRDVYVVQLVSESQDPPRFAEFVGSFALTT